MVEEVILDGSGDGTTPWIIHITRYKEERRLIALSGSAIFILDDTTLEQVGEIPTLLFVHALVLVYIDPPIFSDLKF